MPDPFWFSDPSILIKPDRLIEFFPNNDFNLDEKLNSIVRLGMYLSIVFIIYKKDINWISIFIFIVLLTYYIHSNYNPISNQENFEANLNPNEFPNKTKINDTTDKFNEIPKNCTKPTLDNPFMNLTMADLLNTQNNGDVKLKPLACDINNPVIKKSIDTKFKNNLFRDINDVFGQFNSQRQFFTMPWTGIIPDSNGDFKNWLYNQPSTCHENPDNCIRGNYEDLRAKSFVPPNE